jgi:hypothetical protein
MYSDVVRRLGQLRKHFLPATFAPTGIYSRLQQDKVRGYRLLVHAELESYLEDRARRVANDAYNGWLSDHRPRGVLLSLLAFHKEQRPLSEQELREVSAGTRDHVANAVKDAVEAYNRVLTENHGLRERNVLRILLPLGMKGSDVDAVWLNTLDAFGLRRGQTAHTSVSAQQQLDPKTEFDTVEAIMAGLLDVDTKFDLL